MATPEPIDSPDLESWGLIFELDAEDIYWFDSPGDIVAFLHLGVDKYLRRSDSSSRELLAKELAMAWPEVEREMDRDGRSVDGHMAAASSRVRLVRQLPWYGQFKKLLQSDDAFPTEVRALFLRCSGVTDHWPRDDIVAEHFEEWLQGLDGHEELACAKMESGADLGYSRPPHKDLYNEGGVWRRRL